MWVSFLGEMWPRHGWNMDMDKMKDIEQNNCTWLKMGTHSHNHNSPFWLPVQTSFNLHFNRRLLFYYSKLKNPKWINQISINNTCRICLFSSVCKESGYPSWSFRKISFYHKDTGRGRRIGGAAQKPWCHHHLFQSGVDGGWRNVQGGRSRMQTVRFHTPMRVHLSDARIWGYGNGVATEKGNYFMHSRWQIPFQVAWVIGCVNPHCNAPVHLMEGV